MQILVQKIKNHFELLVYILAVVLTGFIEFLGMESVKAHVVVMLPMILVFVLFTYKRVKTIAKKDMA